MNKETRKEVLVLNPVVAKKLLRLGYRIIDIAPDKRVPNKTLFLFAEEGKIREDFEKIKQNPYDK